MLTPIL